MSLEKNDEEYGERDEVNFNRNVRDEFKEKVRNGLIKEEWFKFLYKKKGVKGKYKFGVGIDK